MDRICTMSALAGVYTERREMGKKREDLKATVASLVVAAVMVGLVLVLLMPTD